MLPRWMAESHGHYWFDLMPAVIRYEVRLDESLSEDQAVELSDYILALIVEQVFVTSVDAIHPLRDVGANKKERE